MKKQLFTLVALVVAGALPSGAFFEEAPYRTVQGEAAVRRGTPARQGNAWVEQAEIHAPARAGGRLVVRADFGSVHFRPGTDGQVNCRVHLRAYVANEEMAGRLLHNYELGVRTLEGGGVAITGRWLSDSRHGPRLAVDFDVAVPLRFNVDVETKGGELAVERLDGEFRGVTAGGDIRAGDITGPVTAGTAGGDVDLGNIGQRLNARTAGGSIHVSNVKGDATLETSGGEISAGDIQGGVQAETAGGDIFLRGATGPVKAETAGGQIFIGQCGATVSAESAGGSIRLQGAEGAVQAETAGGSIDLFRVASAVRAETAAGRILLELNARPNSFAQSRLATAIGDVQVFLPPDLPINIDAMIEEALGHAIESDFPLQRAGNEQSYRRRTERAAAALNGGGKVLLIRSVAGNIEIRRVDSPLLQQLRARQEAMWKQSLEKMEARCKLRLKQVETKNDGGQDDEE